MLSRHADGLYWLGRYIERAADVNRLLDVAYNAQLERGHGARSDVWRNLLRVLYCEGEFAAAYGNDLSAGNINGFLVFDGAQPGSISASVRTARTNVMNVRDAVPIELLEAVNALHIRLASGSLRQHAEMSPHQIYEAIASDCRRISGAVADGMARTDEFRFLMLGRMLERAEMSCRVLEVNASVGRGDAAVWIGALRSLSGLHAFLRSHGPLAPAAAIVGFMLHNETFPFGVLSCLREAGAHLRAVSDAATWQSPRSLGRVTSQVEFMDIPNVDSDTFESTIDDILISIRRVAESLTDDLYRFGREPSLFSFEAI